MSANSIKRTAHKTVNYAARVLPWLAYVALGFIVLLTFSDVFMRYLFAKPILGGTELTELGMATLAAFAMFYTAMVQGHISVDVLVTRFPSRIQKILQRIGSGLGFVIYALIGYEAWLVGMSGVRLHIYSSVLHIIVGPFMLIMGLGLLLYSLTLLIQAINPPQSVAKEEILI